MVFTGKTLKNNGRLGIPGYCFLGGRPDLSDTSSFGFVGHNKKQVWNITVVPSCTSKSRQIWSLVFLAPLAPKISLKISQQKNTHFDPQAKTTLSIKSWVFCSGSMFYAKEINPLNPLKVPKTTLALQMATLVTAVETSNGPRKTKEMGNMDPKNKDVSPIENCHLQAN